MSRLGDPGRIRAALEGFEGARFERDRAAVPLSVGVVIAVRRHLSDDTAHPLPGTAVEGAGAE